MSGTLGVILAGGLARRMGGGDKCLLPLGGQPILSHVIARLSGQVDALVLNTNGDPARFSAFELPVIADTLPGYPGPLAGVLAGMEAARARGMDDILTVAADTPFFPTDMVDRMRSARGDAPIVLAATPDPEQGLNRHPTFGLWSASLAPDLRRALEGGLRKVVAWTDPQGAVTAEFSATPEDPFFNINTPDDLAQAEDRLA